VQPHTAICLRNPDLHRRSSKEVLVTAMEQRQDTAKKNKGPPKFQHLPKERGTTPRILLIAKNSHSRNHPAKKLKSAWIQTRKIKSKWNAEKRRQGIQMGSPPTAPELETTVSNVSRTPGRQKPDHQPQLVNVDTGSGVSPTKSMERPAKASNSRTIKEPVRTARTDPATGPPQQKDRRPAKKPSMRNRMNALLEKIQRGTD